MVAFVALLFPAVLSVWFWEIFTKKTLTNRQWVYLYAANGLIINFVCFALKRWALNTGDYAIDVMTPNSAMNYILVAAVVAVVLSLIEWFCYKRVRIRLESSEENEYEEKDR